MHVALRGVELRVPGQLSNGFEVGAAAYQRREEEVAQCVEAPEGERVTDEQRVQLGPNGLT